MVWWSVMWWGMSMWCKITLFYIVLIIWENTITLSCIRPRVKARILFWHIFVYITEVHSTNMLWSDYCGSKILNKYINQCDMGECKSKWKQSMHIVFTLYLPIKLKFCEKLRSNFHSCTLYHVGHILLCKSLSLGCLNFNINVVLKSMAFVSLSL
jgi:hypothetical protein